MPMAANGRDTIDLARPSFVFALALLLANDLVLKAAYPGWITGKLSDFAGLFVLPYFLAWLWPSRRLALHVGVALAFVAWKLPLSRPFVELWNAAPSFDIARVEDLTDLIALPSVALSFFSTARATQRIAHVPNIAIALVALLALTATSRTDLRAELRGTYLFPGHVDELEARLNGVHSMLKPPGSGRPPVGDIFVVSDSPDDTWLIELPETKYGSGCSHNHWVQYEADLRDFGDAVLVDLRAVRGGCAFDSEDMSEIVRAFNERIARPVGLRPARPIGQHTHRGNTLP
jgi:hypothetical protein